MNWIERNRAHRNNGYQFMRLWLILRSIVPCANKMEKRIFFGDRWDRARFDNNFVNILKIISQQHCGNFYIRMIIRADWANSMSSNSQLWKGQCFRTEMTIYRFYHAIRTAYTCMPLCTRRQCEHKQEQHWHQHHPQDAMLVKSRLLVKWHMRSPSAFHKLNRLHYSVI